jgi:uncharacterized protein (DUF433 family)
MSVHPRIEINPKVMLGKPVIRGTRITVELIVRKLSEGADERSLTQAHQPFNRKPMLHEHRDKKCTTSVMRQ